MPITQQERGGRLWQSLREFLYGLTGYQFVQQSVRIRADMENLFILVTLGDMIGLPILPPYYSLRLVPFVVPQIAAWKRRVLRERHHLEKEEYDLIEM